MYPKTLLSERRTVNRGRMKLIRISTGGIAALLPPSAAAAALGLAAILVEGLR